MVRAALQAQLLRETGRVKIGGVAPLLALLPLITYYNFLDFVIYCLCFSYFSVVAVSLLL